MNSQGPRLKSKKQTDSEPSVRLDIATAINSQGGAKRLECSGLPELLHLEKAAAIRRAEAWPNRDMPKSKSVIALS
jgi:hypothetical protein